MDIIPPCLENKRAPRQFMIFDIFDFIIDISFGSNRFVASRLKNKSSRFSIINANGCIGMNAFHWNWNENDGSRCWSNWGFYGPWMRVAWFSFQFRCFIIFFKAFDVLLWLPCRSLTTASHYCIQIPCLLLSTMVKWEIFDLPIKNELYQHIP